MTTVGVRELKNRLSHYLKRAQEGEQILVTARGVPIVELRPVTPLNAEEALWDLVRRGIARWNGKQPRYDFPPIEISGKPLSEIIIEQREDRL